MDSVVSSEKVTWQLSSTLVDWLRYQDKVRGLTYMIRFSRPICMHLTPSKSMVELTSMYKLQAAAHIGVALPLRASFLIILAVNRGGGVLLTLALSALSPGASRPGISVRAVRRCKTRQRYRSRWQLEHDSEGLSDRLRDDVRDIS